MSPFCDGLDGQDKLLSPSPRERKYVKGFRDRAGRYGPFLSFYTWLRDAVPLRRKS